MLRRLWLPVLVVLPVFATLLYLGQWQYQRLGWKNALVAQIAAAEAAPPVPLSANPPQFTRILVRGQFDHARESLLGLEVRGPILGARLLTPLRAENGTSLLIDRGWVPVESRAAIARPEGLVELIGFARPTEPRSRFAAADDTARRRFFTFDIPVIGTAIGLTELAPFALVAVGSSVGLPDPARMLPRPTNNHLGYAVTWFGLALSLAGVFAFWVARRLKEPR